MRHVADDDQRHDIKGQHIIVVVTEKESAILARGSCDVPEAGKENRRNEENM